MHEDLQQMKTKTETAVKPPRHFFFHCFASWERTFLLKEDDVRYRYKRSDGIEKKNYLKVQTFNFACLNCVHV